MSYFWEHAQIWSNEDNAGHQGKSEADEENFPKPFVGGRQLRRKYLSTAQNSDKNWNLSEQVKYGFLKRRLLNLGENENKFETSKKVM